jgi:DNA-binding transcriptional regulator YdaS (Cro superfamily)
MKKLSARMLAARLRRERRHLDRAIEHVGSQSELARLLGVSPQAVRQWYTNETGVPPRRCPQIERLTRGKVMCEQLREEFEWVRVIRKGARE